VVYPPSQVFFGLNTMIAGNHFNDTINVFADFLQTLLDYDDNCIIDKYDVEQFCIEHGTPTDEIWIFDLADLVVYGWDYQNHGSKLVQVRFYPVDATQFVE
jgi:hypothetical protein